MIRETKGSNMKKYFEGEIRNSSISGNFQIRSDESDGRSYGRLHLYVKMAGSVILKFFYVLLAMCGLGGVIISIIKIIFLSSISDFDMILIFGVACISIGAICAGISGLYKMKIDGKEGKLNITNATFAD